MAPRLLRRRRVVALEHPPQSAEREAAAEQVDPNQPRGEDISKVMEQIAVGHAVHGRVDGKREEKKGRNRFESVYVSPAHSRR